ncbi:MAG: stealth conserved region 3 domain-containing protein [Rhodobacter sp.]|nr:stealth conserved region 3 domain-containing protein [Rhodobacter sp.]
MANAKEPIDIVYTWVDDSFAGYREELNRYVADKRDTNPNRTRDNLDIIRYSMRSVARYLPQVRKIHFVSCRPQIPAWLDPDHPKLDIVHHDRIMAPGILPTFNSFCIVSHLHLIPGLSRRFVYFEDDMLAMSPDLHGALFAPDGRPLVHCSPDRVLPLHRLNPATSSPWNLSLANADAALSDRFGPGPRQHVIHGPQVMDVDVCEAMCREFPALIETTRRSRFRGIDNVPPEFLARHMAVETGAAVLAGWGQSSRVQGYVSLENFAPWTWWQLRRVEARKALSVTLNDSFGGRPNPRVEAMVRARLHRWFPDPAPWEMAARGL